MSDFGVTAPAVYGADGDGSVEGIERAAASGVDGVEFFDWESAETGEPYTVTSRRGGPATPIL